MRTPNERLDIAKTNLDTAFQLINDLWANKHLDLVINNNRQLTEQEKEIRELIVSTRMAIINASNQVELLLDKN